MVVKRYADVPVSQPPRKMMRIVVKSWSRFSLPYIPHDVIFNILSRLPSKSVIRFKSVCKAWHAMISNPCFINAHLECSKERRSILMSPGAYEKQKNGESISFIMGFYKYHVGNVGELIHLEDFPEGIALWTRPLHCNGLILISTLNYEMMICNPATREFVTLPKGSHNLDKSPRVGFGFDPYSKKYKVARFFCQKDDVTSDFVCKYVKNTM